MKVTMHGTPFKIRPGWTSGFKSCCDTMPPARLRYNGSAAGLAHILFPFVLSVNWFTYSEKVDDKIDSVVLIRIAALLRELTVLAPNMAFKQKVMSRSLSMGRQPRSWRTTGT
eukprot:11987047-Heterocapsa_arctica.AAC.1